MDIVRQQRRSLLLSWCPGQSKGDTRSLESIGKGHGSSTGTNTKYDVQENSLGICSLLLAEIDSCSSSGDWEGLQVCYKIVKKSLAGDTTTQDDGLHSSALSKYDALICSLKLLEACIRVCRQGNGTIETQGSVVVGALLAAGICLSSCASNKSVTVRICEEGHLQEFLKGFEETMQLFEGSKMPRGWEQYSMTLFKAMNRSALGFLSYEMEEYCLEMSEKGIICLATRCFVVAPKALKALSAMSQHVSDKSRWLCLFARALDVSMAHTSSCDLFVIENCMSCTRRMLLDVLEANDSSWTNTDFGKKLDVYTRILSCINFLYTTSGHEDLHSGIIAMGVVSRDMCRIEKIDSQTVSLLCNALWESLSSLLGIGESLDDFPSKSRLKLLATKSALDDIKWLSRTFHKCGLSESCSSHLKYTMLCSSVMCGTVVLHCLDDTKETIADHITEAVCHLANLSNSHDTFDNQGSISYFDVLKKVVHTFEDLDINGHLPKLFAKLVKKAYYNTNQTLFRVSKFILELSDEVKKKRMDKNMLLSVLKYSIVSLSTMAEALPTSSMQLESEIRVILDVLKIHFNPGKTPDAYLDVLLICHRHNAAFPGLFSARQFSLEATAILGETKTKIGHKRIEEVQSIIDLLMVEERVGSLLQESHEYHKKVTEERKKWLLRDPSVIHSEGWAYSSFQRQVEQMMGNQTVWMEVIQQACQVINKARRSSTLSCSMSIVQQLEEFVNLHRPSTFPSTGSFSFWECISYAEVDKDFNIEKCMMELARLGKAENKHAFELSKLNISVSKNYALRGDIYSALFHAIEAHKYASQIGACILSDTASDVAAIRYWTHVSAYLGSCSWLGFLLSVCGMYEESIQAYHEGLKLSCLLGSSAASLQFTVSLAEVHMIGGDDIRFQAMVNQSVSLEVSSDLVETSNDPIICLRTHLEILRANLDRKNLEFVAAKSKIDASRSLLDGLDGGHWYHFRVLAASTYEDMLIELDEKSSVTPCDIQVSISKVLQDWEYDNLLLGAPFSSLFVLQAQLLAQSCFELNQGNDPCIWISKNSSMKEHISLIEDLWNLSAEVNSSPFCQKVIFLLLAPICAFVGCKFAAIFLLHTSSNTTLQFQQELILRTKRRLRSLKSGDVRRLSLGDSDHMAFPHQINTSNANFTVEDFESKAKSMVFSWMDALQDLVICGVSVYNSRVFGPSSSIKDKLVLFRLRKGQVPLIVEIPSPEVESSHPIHLLHGTKSCGAIELLENKLQDILRKSQSNMRSISATSTEVEQRSWWRERIDLDHSMQELLQDLHTEWIGPWRCLFMDLQLEAGNLKDEVTLLTALLSIEKSEFSKDDLESLSRILNVARGSKDIKFDADKFDGDKLLETFEKLHLGERAPPNPVNRKVTFKSPCKENTLDAFYSSPESMTVVRSKFNDISERLSGVQLVDIEDSNAIDTPALPTMPDNEARNAKSTAKRKHKSRLPQMHSFMTPNPRGTLKARNVCEESFRTPKTSIKHFAGASVTPLCDRTKTMPPLRHSHAREEDRECDECMQVVLVLDQAIHSLPWESSFSMISTKRWEFYRIPSLPAFVSMTRRKQMISVDSCYYAINPSGDLISTQKTFEDWFKGMKGWRGRAGSPPNPAELANALQEHDLFLYCGHGGGEQYLPLSRLRSLDSCASSILMGCSSGKLKWNNRGAYEASGVILAYILAGCPAVVGNLWDVTDKDIDRYCQEMICKMISSKAKDGKTSIGHVVQNSRHACKLPYLIGAAPVCYGIPAKFT